MEQIHALKDMLSKEMDIYKILLALSHQKKDIIIHNELTELNNIVKQEADLMNQLKPLEKSRESLLAEISAKNNLTDEILSIDAVIDQCSGSFRIEFKQLRIEFKKILLELEKINEINRRLIYTQLEYTSFCIETLSQSVQTGDTYGSKGYLNENQSSRFNLMDQKI